MKNIWLGFLYLLGIGRETIECDPPLDDSYDIKRCRKCGSYMSKNGCKKCRKAKE